MGKKTNLKVIKIYIFIKNNMHFDYTFLKILKYIHYNLFECNISCVS